MNSIYGFKVGQSQSFDSAGKRVPVTLVRVEPNLVIGWRTMEKDGYNALKVALGSKKHPNKPLQGLLKNISDKISPRYIREIRVIGEEDKKDVGAKIQIADIFAPGDVVDVSGISLGKGFAGVVKRHGFAGGPHTHGQSDRERHPGSIGQTTTPGRVYKGKRMAGHMGRAKRTIRNLQIFAVKPEEQLLLVTGLVPGHKGGLLKVTKAS